MAASDIVREVAKWRRDVENGTIGGGGGGASVQASWRFSTSTVSADPGNGRFRLDNADASLATAIFVDDQTNGGFDFSAIFNALQNGDKIYIQNDTDATESFICTVSSVVDNTGWFTINITVDQAGADTAWTNNSVFGFLFFSSGGTSSPGGADTNVQYNDSGAFAGSAGFTFEDNFLAPLLTLGVGGAVQSPNIVLNGGTGGGAEINWEQNFTQRGKFQFIPSAAGFTNIIRLTSQAGPFEIASSATVNMRIQNGVGWEMFGGSGMTLRMQDDATGAYPDTAGFGQLYVDEGDGLIKFRNSVGTIFDLTDNGAPAGATNELQFNTGGALDADPFLSVDLTAGSGQAPQLRLDGTSGSYRRPTLVFNYDLSDEGGIEWEEEGGSRGYIRYYATGPGGGTDVLRIWNPVNGGATSNSITEIGAENLLRYRANEEGNDFRGPIRVDSVPGPAFPDTVGHGVIFLDDGDGDVKFRNSAGAEFSMTSGLGSGGNVSNTGTPLDNQVAVWTDATTIEGSTGLTWNGTTFHVAGAANFDDSITVNGATTAVMNLVSVASNARLNLDGPGPQIRFDQSGAGLDQKIWEINAESEELRFRLSDDAFGNDFDWMVVARSGTGAGVTADSVTFNAPIDVVANLFDLDNSGTAAATTIIARNSAGGATLNINTTTGNAQIGQTSGAGAAEDVWINFTRNSGMTFRANNTQEMVLGVGFVAIDNELQIETWSEDADSYASAAAGTKTLDVSAATYFYPDTTFTAGAYTFAFSNPPATGRAVAITVELLDADNATSITWPASVEWPGGTEPTWSTGVDVVSFVTRDNGTTWRGYLGGLDFS